MTGAGFAAGDSEIGPVRIEVRSVNGRGLSLKLRIPSGCSGFESSLEERLRARLGRGSVLVVVERTANPSTLPDRATLRAVAAELRELAEELQLQQPGLMDVVQAASSGSGRSEASTSRPLPERLGALFDAALGQLLAHRQEEGSQTVAAIVAVITTSTATAVVPATAVVAAEHSSDSLVACRAPPAPMHQPLVVPLDLSVNGADYSSAAPAFEYLVSLFAGFEDDRLDVKDVDFDVIVCATSARVQERMQERVQERMQDGGWEPDLERWESDEGSEDSEVEHDGDEAAGAALSEAQVLRLMV